MLKQPPVVVPVGNKINNKISWVNYVKITKVKRTLPNVNWNSNTFQSKWYIKNSMKNSTLSFCPKITSNYLEHPLSLPGHWILHINSKQLVSWRVWRIWELTLSNSLINGYLCSKFTLPPSITIKHFRPF